MAVGLTYEGRATTMHDSVFAERIDRQRQFLMEDKPGFLVFAKYLKHTGGRENPFPSPPRTLSKELAQSHAFEYGANHAIQRYHQALDEYAVDVDSVVCLEPGMIFGTAFRPALVTGCDLVFHEGTSYTSEDYLDSWEKQDTLNFDMANDWVEIYLDYWRGIVSALEPGIALSVLMYRSPLDMAQSLRGSGFYLDFYDHPEKVDQLVSFCTDWLVAFDKLVRRHFPVLESAVNGVCGYGFNTRCVRLNGDPVDMISEDLIHRFHTPSIRALSEYAEDIFFHHHSLGLRTARIIGETPGITVQQFQQDPNTPALVDSIDDALIEASLRTPIELDINLDSVPNLTETVDRLSQGRFIVHVTTDTREECSQLVKRVRSMTKA